MRTLHLTSDSTHRGGRDGYRRRQATVRSQTHARTTPTRLLNGVAQGVRGASEETSLARAGDVRETGDEGEAMLQDAIRFALISMKCEMVVRIDRALERLDEGHYGMCDDCGEDIAESRLRALPFAERCRRCEELREDVERQAACGRIAGQ